MNVYRLEPDDQFHNFALVDERASPIFSAFDGTPVGPTWRPLDIMAADTDDELAVLGDHALLGSIPVFSERAVDVLGDTLRLHGELLPLVYARRGYFAYNVTSMVDALDEQGSRLTRFSSGRVMSIEEYAFCLHKVTHHPIFKIPQLPRAFVFVTDPFVERVRDAQLLGFAFRELGHAKTSP